MLAKDDLFKLIKAMSKNEKRYFSLDAQKSGKKGSRYLDLFHALNEMESLDENKLKKKFPKNLSSDKGYLYDAILRSMRDYRSPKSKAAQIKERIQDSRYLFERGLYKQCNSRLKEADEMSRQLGDELMLLEVARERLLTIKSNKEKNLVDYVSSLLEDKKKALYSVNQYFKYSDAYYETIMKVTKNFQSPVEEREQISLPAFFEEEKDIEKSAQTERRYLQSQALFYQLKGDNKNVLKYFRKTADWWERHSAFKSEEYFRYISDVSNLVYAFFANNLFEEAETYIRELRQNKPDQPHERRVWLENMYLYQLLLMLNSKNYHNASRLIDEIDEGIVKYGFTNNHVLSCNIGILYFLIGSFGKCREWSARVINTPKLGLRIDIQVLVRILNLICLSEMEEVEKLENETRSTTRFFKKNGIANTSFEGQVLRRLTGIFRADYFKKSELKEELKDFLSKKNPSNSNNGLAEPLMMWLEPVLLT